MVYLFRRIIVDGSRCWRMTLRLASAIAADTRLDSTRLDSTGNNVCLERLESDEKGFERAKRVSLRDGLLSSSNPVIRNVQTSCSVWVGDDGWRLESGTAGKVFKRAEGA